MNKRTVLVQGIRLLFWSLFAGLFVGGIIGGLRLVRQLEVPSPEISAALIAGALGLIGVLWNQRSISRRQIEAAHHEQKAHVYSTFVDDIVMGTLQRGTSRAVRFYCASMMCSVR